MSDANQLRAMIWVQHLLGIGHLRRAVSISRALADADFNVMLVSGGIPITPFARLGATTCWRFTASTARMC